MQYGLDINTYGETKEASKIKKMLWMKTSIVKLSTILVVGILLARVNLLLNQSDSSGIAPFGIAYLMAIVIKNDKKKSLVAAIGVVIGYLTINKLLTDGFVYLIITVILGLYCTIISTKKRKRELLNFTIVLFSFFIYGFLINRYEFGVNITLSLLETLVIIPIYYVIRYALNSLEEINTNYFFASEEIVSIGILVCLLVAGIGEVTLMNYSIRNILALGIVLSVAYIGGATYGAMIGVSMGIILGVASNDMMSWVSFYGVGGLIVGIFKDTGKLFSILSGIIIYLALGLYSDALTLKLVIEVLGGSILFLCIPKSIYRGIEIEINSDRKRDTVNDIHLNGIKEEFTFKLKELTGVLSTVSKCLGDINTNENLLMKNKSSALIGNLADRSCSNCATKASCWERDFHQTYNSFQVLIENCEDGKPNIPKNLENICIKNFALLRNAQELVNNYTLNETVKERLEEGRQLLSTHIINIGSTLEDLLDDFKREVTISSDLERIIKRGLNRNSISYNNVFCYTDTNGRIKVRISMDNCEGANYCSKSIIPLLNDIMRIPVCISGDGCTINPQTNECIINIEEQPKYYMISYGAMAAKDGESQTGDNYSFGKTIDGCYMTIVSDGMGSGPQAGEESKATVDLVEKFMEAGFNEDITVNTVNSIMGMKFAEEEKYATLDLSKVDLYSGDAIFVKIGAVPTFIKRGKKVSVISSKNLPFGLVDDIDVEIIHEDLKPGDILVNVSDGVLDIDKLNSEQFIWLEEYLKDSNTDPRELSAKILEKARNLSGGILKDDMTVVVSKVYSAH